MMETKLRLKKLLIRNHNFDIQIITNKFNQGQSKSIQIGLNHASGEVVGLIDTDYQKPPLN